MILQDKLCISICDKDYSKEEICETIDRCGKNYSDLKEQIDNECSLINVTFEFSASSSANDISLKAELRTADNNIIPLNHINMGSFERNAFMARSRDFINSEPSLKKNMTS